MTLNGAIVTKSCDGAIFVWAYDQDKKDEGMVIPLNKYETVSSLPFEGKYKHSIYRISLNLYDHFIISPHHERTVRVYYPRNE